MTLIFTDQKASPVVNREGFKLSNKTIITVSNQHPLLICALTCRMMTVNYFRKKLQTMTGLKNVEYLLKSPKSVKRTVRVQI